VTRGLPTRRAVVAQPQPRLEVTSNHEQMVDEMSPSAAKNTEAAGQEGQLGAMMTGVDAAKGEPSSMTSNSAPRSTPSDAGRETTHVVRTIYDDVEKHRRF